MMNRSNSDQAVFEDKWVFLSVFCSREKWHVLTGAIRGRLAGLRKDGLALEKSLVFFSLRRGPSIRLALHFSRVTENDCRAVEASILAALAENPCADQKSEMPTGSFFLDFPHGDIKYNLFDERYILSGELPYVQALLSAILCGFFEDHPVDEEGIFTLLTYLQREIIERVYDSARERMEFCGGIIRELSRVEGEMIPVDENLGRSVAVVTLERSVAAAWQTDVFDLLACFGEACAAWCRGGAEPVKGYLTLLSLIQLHLFRLPSHEFLASLPGIDTQPSRIF